MIQVSNITEQVLQPAQALTFDKTRPSLKAGCGECFNSQIPTSVKLTGGCGSIYRLSFSGNITAAAAATPVQLAIAIAGQVLPETVMNATPTAAGDLVNVHTDTLLRLSCGDMDRISVVNSGTNPVTVAANANLNIVRKS